MPKTRKEIMRKLAAVKKQAEEIASLLAIPQSFFPSYVNSVAKWKNVPLRVEFICGEKDIKSSAL